MRFFEIFSYKILRFIVITTVIASLRASFNKSYDFPFNIFFCGLLKIERCRKTWTNFETQFQHKTEQTMVKTLSKG